jgi:hypothetical protein
MSRSVAASSARSQAQALSPAIEARRRLVPSRMCKRRLSWTQWGAAAAKLGLGFECAFVCGLMVGRSRGSLSLVVVCLGSRRQLLRVCATWSRARIVCLAAREGCRILPCCLCWPALGDEGCLSSCVPRGTHCPDPGPVFQIPVQYPSAVLQYRSPVQVRCGV